MKYKIGIFITSIIVFIALWNIVPTQASIGALSEYNYVYIIYDSNAYQYRVMVAGTAVGGQYSGGTYYLTVSNYSSVVTSSSNRAWCEQFVEQYWNTAYAYASITNATGYYTYNYLHVYKGNIGGVLKPDSIVPTPEPTPVPEWYDTMWDTLEDYFTNPVPFEWFKNLIDKVFGDENNGGTISDNVTIGNPTIAPTPTPIPYTTVVVPKTDLTTGDTYYETNYYYVNPSGTPIITSYPPVNSPTNNSGGDGNQTYNPINGKPYSIPRLDWLSSVDIDGTGYDGIDSIGDGMSSIDEIGSEYTDGMSAVSDASGTLPSSWLLLIGIVAAIPLLAGIVSRFLGG